MTTKKPSENTGGAKAPLNKVQKFYIAGHRAMDLKTMANTVGASIKLVRAHLAYLDKRDADKAAKAIVDAEAAAIKVAKAPPDPGVKPMRDDDLMGKSKRGGVTIMTEAASERGDAARIGNHMSPKLAKNTMKIRD
mgnify:CR=1 FL=1